MAISARTGEGVDELLGRAGAAAARRGDAGPAGSRRRAWSSTASSRLADAFSVEREDGAFRVRGRRIERLGDADELRQRGIGRALPARPGSPGRRARARARRRQRRRHRAHRRGRARMVRRGRRRLSGRALGHPRRHLRPARTTAHLAIAEQTREALDLAGVAVHAGRTAAAQTRAAAQPPPTPPRDGRAGHRRQPRASRCCPSSSSAAARANGRHARAAWPPSARATSSSSSCRSRPPRSCRVARAGLRLLELAEIAVVPRLGYAPLEPDGRRTHSPASVTASSMSTRHRWAIRPLTSGRAWRRAGPSAISCRAPSRTTSAGIGYTGSR